MAATVAVLAGGRGTRIGGDKALAQLGGVPLIEYALRCARAAQLDVCVVAKRDTRLPPLGVPVLLEPDQPAHPLCGIVTALETYPAVVALPCDMPFLPPAVLTQLAVAQHPVMLTAPGEPFPALYTEATLDVLQSALAAEASLRSVLAKLDAPALDDIDPSLLFSVNSRSDLELALRQLKDGRPSGHH